VQDHVTHPHLKILSCHRPMLAPRAPVGNKFATARQCGHPPMAPARAATAALPASRICADSESCSVRDAAVDSMQTWPNFSC
jgi:hypothetical protein